LTTRHFQHRGVEDEFDGAKPAYDYWCGAAVQNSMPAVLRGIVQAIMMLLLEKAGGNTASEVRLKMGVGDQWNGRFL
jgi:hypothetical protein